ncbi:MAG TPA: riboflavin synthase [Spirochaetota bacterium]|nr:riboflavin synthase [Spirochaetota bacterium]
MFTGIIEETGILKSISNGKILISVKTILSDLKIGDSVAVNGVCLTVTGIDSSLISFDVSPTTTKLSRFKVGEMRIGEDVNLERALSLNTRLGGHIVSGHIDGVCKIIEITKKDESFFYEFLYPKEIKSLIIPKGSVTIDGISLTISNVLSSSFLVTVIPQTIKETNLKNKRVGDFTHIEADIFARYIKHILLSEGLDGENKKIIERFF